MIPMAYYKYDLVNLAYDAILLVTMFISIMFGEQYGCKRLETVHWASYLTQRWTELSWIDTSHRPYWYCSVDFGSAWSFCKGADHAEWCRLPNQCLHQRLHQWQEQRSYGIWRQRNKKPPSRVSRDELRRHRIVWRLSDACWLPFSSINTILRSEEWTHWPICTTVTLFDGTRRCADACWNIHHIVRLSNSMQQVLRIQVWSPRSQ